MSTIKSILKSSLPQANLSSPQFINKRSIDLAAQANGWEVDPIRDGSITKKTRVQDSVSKMRRSQRSHNLVALVNDSDTNDDQLYNRSTNHKPLTLVDLVPATIDPADFLHNYYTLSLYDWHRHYRYLQTAITPLGLTAATDKPSEIMTIKRSGIVQLTMFNYSFTLGKELVPAPKLRSYDGSEEEYVQFLRSRRW